GRVRGGRGIPSTSAVQTSPLTIGWPTVSVPELTISPALSGCDGKRRAMATPSSARHRAGLFRAFLPEPSSTNSALFRELFPEDPSANAELLAEFLPESSSTRSGLVTELLGAS